MEPLQKKVLGWGLATLTIVGAVFLLVLTDRTLNTAATTNTVSFSGRGSVTAIPDVAVVTLTILTEANTSEAAQSANSERSQGVVAYLEDQGIEERDIQTSGYNINPRYVFPEGGPRSVSGYEVRQTITVKIRDLDAVGTILEGVVRAGVNQVSNVNLTIDDPEALREEAREKAIADAKEKARNLERQLDISLGRIINFSENGSGGVIALRSFAEDAVGVGGAGPVPDIPAGENEIIVNVTLTWQIK